MSIPGIRIHEAGLDEESDGQYHIQNPFVTSSERRARESMEYRRRTRLLIPSRKLDTSSLEPLSQSTSVNRALPDYVEEHVPPEDFDFLDHAVDSDFQAVQDGISYALGSKDQLGTWKVGSSPKEEHTDDTNYFDRYPETHPDYTPDKDLTYDIPLITFNQPDSSPSTSGRPQLKLSTQDLDVLEAGAYKTLPKPPQSPSKLPGIFTRMSNRIAGDNNPPPTPSTDKHTSFNTLLNPVPSPRSATSPKSTTQDLYFADARSEHYSDAQSGQLLADESIRSGPTLSTEGNLNISNPTLQRTHSEARLGINVGTAPVTAAAAPLFSSSKRTERFDHLYLYGNSLGIFSKTNKIRIMCHRLMSHPMTSPGLLLLLIFQTVLLSYREWNPEALDGYYYSGYNWADYILMGINIVYTAEIFAKIIAYGFISDRVMFDELGLEYPLTGILLSAKNIVSNIPFTSIIKNTFYKRKLKARMLAYPSDLNGKDDRFLPEAQYDHHASHSRQRSSSAASITEDVQLNRNLKSHNTFLQSTKIRRKVDEMNLHRAYLRTSWQVIDFISMVCFWISLPLSINHYDAKQHIFHFRALSCLRILRLCNLTTGTNIILRAIHSAIPQLVDVSLFICCFWVIFGIVGVQSFKSSLSRHCQWTNPDDPTETYLNSDLYCGSFIGRDGFVRSYLERDGSSSGDIKGFRCPMYSVCQSGENPYGGTVNFDNILQSMQLVFVIMSANTFTDIMYYTMDSDNIGSSLFFIFAIFILTVWLLNVFIAVIVTSFNIAQMEDAEDKKRKDEGRRTSLLAIFGFNDKLHNQKVYPLIQKRAYLRFYYKLEIFFVILIAADLIIQALRQQGMSDSRAHGLYRFEAAVTATLFAEIVIRFALYYPHYRIFFMSRRNSFDLFLAVATGIIILGPVKSHLGHAYYWLSVFQIARFYRVVLAVGITRNLWMKLTNNIKAIFDLALFYYILLFLLSIILTRYFEGTAGLAETTEDFFGSMYTLPNSFMSLYVITTTENWTSTVYGLQENAKSVALRAFGTVFLYIWFVMSNTIILGIFIAVIARTLEVSEEGKRKQQLVQFIEDMTKRLQSVSSETGLLSKMKQKVFKRKDDKNVERAITNLLLSGTAVNEFLEKDIEPEEVDNEEMRPLPRNPVQRWLAINFARMSDLVKNPFYASRKKTTPLESFDPAQFARNVITERNQLVNQQDKYLRDNPMFNTVFYMLGPRHRLRRFCQRLVFSSHGERIDGVEPNKTVGEIFIAFMFLSTVGIVVTTCILTPLFRRDIMNDQGKWNWAFFVDAVFITIFTSELFIKITADGVIFTPNAYMRSSWNWIDLIALTSLWIEFISVLKNDGHLSRIVRGLKALRALRLLTISERAKSNFHYTMISGFGKIMSAALISITLLFPFSLWGLNIFNGRLGSCTNDELHDYECFNEFANEVFNWEVVSPNAYVEPFLNLNDFATSISTLYQIVSLEGWTELLMQVMLSTGEGSPPELFASPFNGVFIILFNNVSIVFILTLFVSVIIDNYSRVTGRAYLTKNQIQWYQVKKFLKQVRPSKRKDLSSLTGFKKICYNLAVEKNTVWWQIMSTCLFLHILALLVETFPEAEGLNLGRYVFLMISSTVFTMNSLMLAYALGYKSFAANKWNIFQAFVSIGAFVTTILSFPIDSGSVFINFNKLFLVAMLIFIFPRSNKLSQLLRFASASFPSLASLIFTWFVVFMVYAIAMNQIFGMTKTGLNTTGNINLRSVPKALILLFRCSFGEGWNDIMSDFLVEAPFCTADQTIDDSDCGSQQYAYILFMSWNVISMYIFVNLFVSLILDSFSYINSGSDYVDLISREEIRKFKRAWQKFDPNGTGFIKPYDLPKFLHSLTGSLSFRFYSGDLSIPELCHRWIKRNNPHDLYDVTVNYDEVERITDRMDIPKIQERRKEYERFLEEALMNMEVHEEPGISFTRILLQIPLYNSFDAGQCLILLDFLDRRLFYQKLEKRMKMKRVYETIAAFTCRWKYVENQRHGVRDTNIGFDTELRRTSYFANEDLSSTKEPLDVHDEVSVSDTEDESYSDSETAPLSKGHHKARKGDYYIPKSPVHLLKGMERFGNDHDHLHQPLDDSHSVSQLSPSIGRLPPWEATGGGDDRSNLSALDLSTIGETLENSSWADAYREVTSKGSSSHKDTSRRASSYGLEYSYRSRTEEDKKSS